MNNPIIVRTIDDVANDFRSLIREKLPFVRTLVKGRQRFVEQLINKDGLNSHLDERWVCFAHEGTLDKLERMFVGEGKVSDFEVVGAARNLFENLVWCLLFRANVTYGLLFYEQLLREQIESIESHIAKIDSEIELFSELERVEDEQKKALFESLASGEIGGSEFAALLKEAEVKLDAHARLEFAIYGAQAAFNGYGFQRHILIEETRPKLESELQPLKSNLKSFEDEMSDATKAFRNTIIGARGRMNWGKAAAEVGMKDEYSFVYSFASKMLHSKAFSTVPNGHLKEAEATLMFEYSYVAARRMLDCLGAGAMSTIPDLSLINIDEI